MTDRLEEAFAKTTRLPDNEQDAGARWLMDELESERHWSRSFETAQRQLADLAREVFGVKYFCRSTSTILAGFGRLLVRRRTVRWALLRVLKTQKTKRRERPLGDVHGVR